MPKRKTILTTIIPILIAVLLPFSQAELPSWMCGPYTLCQVAERYGVAVDPGRTSATLVNNVMGQIETEIVCF